MRGVKVAALTFLAVVGALDGPRAGAGSATAPASAVASGPSGDAAAIVARIVQRDGATKSRGIDMLSAGGDFAVSPRKGEMALDASSFGYRLPQWKQARARTWAADVDLQALLALGPKAAPAVNDALPKTGPDSVAAEKLALALATVGDRQSVPALIDLLARAGRSDGDGGSRYWERLGILIAATNGLFELTGRQFLQPSKDWTAWWEAVKDDFVVARDRETAQVPPGRVKALVRQLGAEDPFPGRERLIVLGPNAVPGLLEALTGASDPVRFEIAWTVDEIGLPDRLPRDLRMAYFIDRLGKEDCDIPTGSAARLRALTKQPFEDFCRVIMEVDRKYPTEGLAMAGWVKVGDVNFHRLVGDLEKQVPAALPVLMEGLEHSDKAVRKVAVQIIGRIGFERQQAAGQAGTQPGQAQGPRAETPETLLEALERAWLNEPDDWLRYETAVTFSRYPSRRFQDAVKRELWSSRLEILGDAAALADMRGLFRGAEDQEVQARLVELTSHLDDRVRRVSVRSLRTRWPDALRPHLQRLSEDTLPDIRHECAVVIGHMKDPRFTGLLVRLAGDADERLRDSALGYLGDPAFRSAVPDLARLLEDPRCPNRLMLWHTLAQMGGAEVEAALVREVRRGISDDSGLLRAMEHLTGQKFAEREPCIRWCWLRREGAADLPDDSPPAPQAEADLRKAWEDLAAGEEDRCFRAFHALMQAGDGTVKFLTDRLAPASVEPADLARLVGLLNSDSFAERTRAFDQLVLVGPAAEAALRAAVERDASANFKAQANSLLAACGEAGPSVPEVRRVIRAIQVLEAMGAPPARQAMEKLAGGARGARGTIHARAALDRLDNAGNQQGEWGAPVAGLQCRLRPVQWKWLSDETPLLRVDIRNTGQDRYEMVPSGTYVRLEVVAPKAYRRVYLHRLRMGKVVPLDPQGEHKDILLVLDGNWLATDGTGPLVLKPGVHTVRAAVIGAPSSEVTMEILAAATTQPAGPQARPKEDGR